MPVVKILLRTRINLFGLASHIRRPAEFFWPQSVADKINPGQEADQPCPAEFQVNFCAGIDSASLVPPNKIMLWAFGTSQTVLSCNSQASTLAWSTSAPSSAHLLTSSIGRNVKSLSRRSTLLSSTLRQLVKIIGAGKLRIKPNSTCFCFTHLLAIAGC